MNSHSIARLGARLASGSVLATALVLAALALPAQSQSVQTNRSASEGPGLSLQYGYHAKYQRIGLAYETPELWNYSFTNYGRIGLGVEFGAGYWKADSSDPDSLWHFSVVPLVRWWPGETYYLEAGVGPSLLSRTRFAGKNLSTRFQFTSHIGGGFLVNDVHRFGLRYTHVSNASIKRPNPGLDLIEATYTYQF